MRPCSALLCSGGGTMASTSSVIATAITPSENDSSRLVPMRPHFRRRSHRSCSVDNGDPARETERMLRPGDARRRMERTLNAAYGDGLLSQQTLMQRLDLLFGSELVDPAGRAGAPTAPPPH